MAGVQRAFDLAQQACADFRVGAVADGFDQQVFEAAVFEHLTQDVEHATAQGCALDLQLFEQPLEDIALTRFGRHHVPQVADLCLADAVDTAEALLQAVRVPGQVVVDHQVGVLQVHTFAGRVGGDEHARRRVVAEQLLHLATLFAFHAAVDHDHSFLTADQTPDLGGQVVQRVAVLGEDDQLALAPRGVVHLGRVL